MLVVSRPRRLARVAGYALIGAGGMGALVWPPTSVHQVATGSLAYVWAAFLVGGGAVCTLGAVTDLWMGEYIGLWPLIVAFAIFGLSAASTGRLASLAGAGVLLGIAGLLAGRWQDVAVLRQEATRAAKDRR